MHNALARALIIVLLAGLALLSAACEDEQLAGDRGSIPAESATAEPIATATPAPEPSPTSAPTITPTATPTLTPTATPTRTPIPTPTPSPLDGYRTQNTGWLQAVHPTLYRQLEELPWVVDGLSEWDTVVIDNLLFVGANDTDTLTNVLGRAWAQDNITVTEGDAIEYLSLIGLYSEEAARDVSVMPFLETVEPDDVLALRGIQRVASFEDIRLSALLNHQTLVGGITDEQTTIVVAASVGRDVAEIRRVLRPGYADIQEAITGTQLTPDLKVSIFRTTRRIPTETIDRIRDAVEFSEGMMNLPLPVSHVIVVQNEESVVEESGGTNFGGYAIGVLPGQLDLHGPYSQALLAHEIAHYFWRGFVGWINEGVADTFEYMYAPEADKPDLISPSRRCQARNLQELTEEYEKHDYTCNYYLGQALFLDLLDDMGEEEFKEGVRELYSLSLAEREEYKHAGIEQVRQAFPEQSHIIEEHWSD